MFILRHVQLQIKQCSIFVAPCAGPSMLGEFATSVTLITTFAKFAGRTYGLANPFASY